MLLLPRLDSGSGTAGEDRAPGRTFVEWLDAYLRLDVAPGVDSSMDLSVLRGRALAVMGPMGGVFGTMMALAQLRVELSGASTAIGGPVGILRIALPLAVAVILFSIPVLLRVTGRVRLCGLICLGAITLALVPWPFVQSGIYSRTVFMLTAMPMAWAFLLSNRAAAVMAILVCTILVSLPVLGNMGVVQQPDGVAFVDSASHCLSALLTTIGLFAVAWTITQLHEHAARESFAARLEAVDLAESDQLTGLANRRIFSRILRERTAKASEDESGVGLILVDLDHFKTINDTYGHTTGDILLTSVAKRLERLCQDYPDSVAARLGGDEFAVICWDDSGGSVVDSLARRLVEAVRAPVMTDHAVLYPTISVGAALLPQDATSVEDLQWIADVALYASKGAGRDQWHRAEPDMIAAVEQRHALVSAMRQPQFTDELEIWYQPQSCMRTGRIVGLEALTRWNHPQFGLLMPTSFIQHAEDNNLIGLLTDHVITKAMEDAAPWFHSGLIDRLAINISGHDLKNNTLVQAVGRGLEHWDLPPSMLELEVTESFFLWNLEATFTVLQALGTRGIRIALDDFGTGYSSLSYLRTLPINTIKIDKSFVFDCDSNPNSLAIVQAIIGLARTLDMETVAEGVETESQKQMLARLGTTRMQGFHHSRPMPADACVAFLKEAAAASAASRFAVPVRRRA